MVEYGFRNYYFYAKIAAHVVLGNEKYKLNTKT